MLDAAMSYYMADKLALTRLTLYGVLDISRHMTSLYGYTGARTLGLEYLILLDLNCYQDAALDAAENVFLSLFIRMEIARLGGTDYSEVARGRNEKIICLN